MNFPIFTITDWLVCIFTNLLWILFIRAYCSSYINFLYFHFLSLRPFFTDSFFSVSFSSLCLFLFTFLFFSQTFTLFIIFFNLLSFILFFFHFIYYFLSLLSFSFLVLLFFLSIFLFALTVYPLILQTLLTMELEIYFQWNYQDNRDNTHILTTLPIRPLKKSGQYYTQTFLAKNTWSRQFYVLAHSNKAYLLYLASLATQIE